MKQRKWCFVLFSVILCLTLLSAGFSYAGTTERITKEELHKELNNPNVVILDVRAGRDWKSSEFKIKGAVRANPSDFDSWITQQSKEKFFVIYCA
jgi:rhodanese-related sulfurtransferase